MRPKGQTDRNPEELDKEATKIRNRIASLERAYPKFTGPGDAVEDCLHLLTLWRLPLDWDKDDIRYVLFYVSLLFTVYKWILTACRFLLDNDPAPAVEDLQLEEGPLALDLEQDTTNRPHSITSRTGGRHDRTSGGMDHVSRTT